MVKSLWQKILKKLRFNPFSRKSHIKLGLYGPPNGGKSTLANEISMDWLGEEMSATSHIPHETREIIIKKGLKKTEAKKRAKEATKGVIDSIKWLDDMDSVVVVLDAAEDPYSQVNITILGNLQARDIPVLIAANKIDLKKASIDIVQAAFPQYKVVGISAKYGKNIEEFYEQLFTLAK